MTYELLAVTCLSLIKQSEFIYLLNKVVFHQLQDAFFQQFNISIVKVVLQSIVFSLGL